MSTSNKQNPLPIINKPAKKKTKKVSVHISETALANIRLQLSWIQKHDMVLSGSIKTVEDFIAFHVEHLAKHFSKVKFDFVSGKATISIPVSKNKNLDDQIRSHQEILIESLNFVEEVNKDNPNKEKKAVEVIKTSITTHALPFSASNSNEGSRKLYRKKIKESEGSYIDIVETPDYPNIVEERSESSKENTQTPEELLKKLIEKLEKWNVDDEIKKGTMELRDEEEEQTIEIEDDPDDYDDDEDFDE